MLEISRSIPGMNNQGKNLMDEAVKRAKDGDLTTQDLTELRQIADAEGGVTGVEEVFLQDLADSAGGQIFIAEINSANFDPNSFKFSTEGMAKVQSANGKEISLEFSDTPIASKQIHGDIDEARRTMLSLIPEDKRDAFAAIDPHQVQDISRFVKDLGLSGADKTRFLQAYMTANFNHTGKNIEWNGVSLQEGINAVPRDNLGRAYLDCEGYAEVAHTVLGDQGFTTLGVATEGPGKKRDHQVSVFREGNNAYALSNNEVVPVPGGAAKTDAEVLEAAFPKQFFDPITDPNGAMLRDTSEFRVGEKIQDEANGDPRTTTVTAIDGANTLRAKVTSAAGESFHVGMAQDPASGQLSSTLTPQVGDTLFLDAGKVEIKGQNGEGLYTDASGNSFHVKVTAQGNGGFKAEKTLQAGDVLINSDGSKVTMSSAQAGVLSDGNTHYHVSLALDSSNDWAYTTQMDFKAGDVLELPAHHATIRFDAPGHGRASFSNGQAPKNVSVTMQGPNQPFFNFVP
ncbi:hypothetical protein COW36_10115 [bacterium (Candidatus Blackallbacteria) CG17_big_fil_post_rev_8_21_14_2_50_48_46]|uniref:Uncharacterized protein n=1 Tax=bacterium (Candidatus Blackallbacteria) CG17_big_fil_post_rev_8_21_14_2_50_48_46 TaxID=2014261 RepID=A0A2M7G583_9BACT|nr:MAG: hypothetical protein COW64_05245 [bacterium (Candidatus Blackallbacteria) CG18_big_fil_WC_8_21_14_2_50_49_26]PIW17097.1 MAG: hypothetical protein COW36_10115 [bacterium (Candidatus Blackallbacteria) CG17_big_fil_post_rev_8_21_14_2_50_48_46]PIW50006.1 MAG: hypothetical protein COW20_03955 [bacterium (Candidatus Blackallbacteria) CG13_big_fil_rev_8_21_14_2_50_49_14]